MNSSLKNSLISFCLLAFSAPSIIMAQPVETSSVTLRQCYEWTRARSETLKIHEEDIKQSNARARAAIGSILPDISWKLTDTWQDPDGVDKLEQKGFAGFVEKEQVESKFSLEQPIFSGFRELSAHAGGKREALRDQLRFKRYELSLFELTATAFYTVVMHETNRNNTAENWRLADAQARELKEFLKLGKARDSEVYTAQAHASALKAKLDLSEAMINSAREELSFLTGHDMMTQPLDDEIPSNFQFASLEESLALAKDRNDLKAQYEDMLARKLRVRYERGFFWPKVGVTGNYYTERATYMDEIDWDVVLNVDVPIYQGGTVAAAVREAKSQYVQARLTYEEMERRVNFNIRQTHGNLTAAIREVRSLEEAALAAQKSYESLRKEYRYGLVTNLDVLQALDLLQVQQNARDAARLKAKQLYIQLNVALEKML